MEPAIYPVYGRRVRAGLLGAGQAVEFTADITAMSNALLNVSSIEGLKHGMKLYGGQGAHATPVTTINVISPPNTVSTYDNMDFTQAGQHLVAVSLGVGISSLDGRPVHLYKEAIAPGPTTTLDELQAGEADFNGYSAPNTPFSVGAVDASGNAKIESDMVTFVPSDGLKPNVIGGAWIDDNTGPIIIFPFESPVVVGDPSAPLNFILVDQVNPPGFSILIVP